MISNTLENNLSRISIQIIVLLILVLGLPLIIGGYPLIENWRVLLLFRGIEFLTVLTGVKVVFSNKKHLFRYELVWLLLGLTIVGFLSVLVSQNPGHSVWGNYIRRDGVLTLLHCILFSVIVAINSGKDLFNLLSKAVAAISVLLSTYLIFWYMILEYSRWQQPLWQLFLTGVWQLPNENMVAGFLVVAAPFTLYGLDLFLPGRKTLRLVLFGLVAVGVLVTQSWGAIVTGILGTAGYLLGGNAGKKKSAAIALILLAGLAAGLILWQSAGNEVEGRSLIFRSLWVSVKEKPLLGWGWSNVDVAFESGYMKIFGSSPEAYVDKAHSIWFEYIVTTGIVGFVVYIALQIRCFFILWHAKFDNDSYIRWALLFGLVLYSIHSQTNVISITEDLFFWIIVGFCLQKVPQQA